jgi:hypothetical protein
LWGAFPRRFSGLCFGGERISRRPRRRRPSPHIITNAGTGANQIILLLAAPAPHKRRQRPHSNLSTLRRPTLYIWIQILHIHWPSVVEHVGPAKGQADKPFLHIFSSSVMGQPEKVLFCWVQTEEKMRKKPGGTASVALLINNFTPALARCGPFFTSRRQRVEPAFKGKIRNILTVNWRTLV